MAQDGYTLGGDRIQIQTKSDWEAWSFPQGTLTVAANGEVRPTRIRKRVNGALDASRLVKKAYDKKWIKWDSPIRGAGSNKEEAIYLLDGDPSTFWEPKATDPLFRWWVEIDLGQLVVADQIVLRFVDKGQGDPFRQFKVFISDGDMAFLGSKALDYALVGRTTKPNEDERVFQFSLDTTVSPNYATTIAGKKADTFWTGEALRYIRINVTDRVEDPETRQGNPETHPRLAEVEVWSAGDNILLDAIERGGQVTEPGIGGASTAADGDILSGWIAFAWSPYRPRATMFIDLGTKFWVDSYQLISWLDTANAGPMYGLATWGSDGSKAPDGTFIWTLLSPKWREQNLERLLYMEDRFERQKIRYIQMRNIDITGSRQGAYGAYGLVSELLIYGEGYVPEVTLTSPLIGLGVARNLSSIEWDVDTPEGTRFEIQTRTGDELREAKHFYNTAGAEVTEKQYNRLPGFSKGGVTTERLPGSGWSNWSPTYLVSGQAITSPSPRRYLMVRAMLRSDDPETFGTLRSINVRFVDPVARRILGEISPGSVKAAASRTFSFFIRPTFTMASPGEKESEGFDQILIQAPASVNMVPREVVLIPDSISVEQLYGEFLSEEERAKLSAQTGEIFSPSNGLEVMPTAPDSMLLRVPRVIKGEQNTSPLIYYRRVKEVATDESGVPLDSTAYRALKADERGSIRYYRLQGGKEYPISRATYEIYPRAYVVRYYRLSEQGEEEQIPFDTQGVPLGRVAYNRLKTAEKGAVVAVGKLVEVQFDAAVFLNGSVFKGAVAHSAVPNSWQRVDPGDATGLAREQTTTVAVAVEEEIVGDIEIQPGVITPNGDGVHEQAVISFTILKLNADRTVRVKIYDLSGRLVQNLTDSIPPRESVNGRYEIPWNGEDSGGQKVSPGAYVCRITVEADTGRSTTSRMIYVVY